MVQFFMLVQTGQGTLTRASPQQVHSSSSMTTQCCGATTLQPTMALSTIKVEYCAFMTVARKVTWLCALLT